jgi:hypothetical protein
MPDLQEVITVLKRDEVLKWLAAYDIQKYPTSVYDELVVEQLPYPGRIKILGAWKTGCLRADGRGRSRCRPGWRVILPWVWAKTCT